MDRETSELVLDTDRLAEIRALPVFRVFEQHGFTETEMSALALLDANTRGMSSADLYELIPRVCTKEEPEMAAEFMRTPNPSLEGHVPLDLLDHQNNIRQLRKATRDFWGEGAR